MPSPKLRGHDEIGLGTILGSNISNGLFIAAVAAIICPIKMGWREVAFTLACGLLAVAEGHDGAVAAHLPRARSGHIHNLGGGLWTVPWADSWACQPLQG